MWAFPLLAPDIGQNVEILRSGDVVPAVKFISVESHRLLE
jgi:hypothetical protein